MWMNLLAGTSVLSGTEPYRRRSPRVPTGRRPRKKWQCWWFGYPESWLFWTSKRDPEKLMFGKLPWQVWVPCQVLQHVSYVYIYIYFYMYLYRYEQIYQSVNILASTSEGKRLHWLHVGTGVTRPFIKPLYEMWGKLTCRGEKRITHSIILIDFKLCRSIQSF